MIELKPAEAIVFGILLLTVCAVLMIASGIQWVRGKLTGEVS